MANMNFGVNLLPVSNKSNSLGSSSKKWDDIYVDKINGQLPTNNDLSATQSAIAIIVNGNTVTTTITEGQYVYIKGSTVLAEGLYTAITAVPFGTVITAQTASTYFIPVSGGGLNAIQQSLATTYEQISASSLGINGDGSIKVFKYGRIIILIFNLAFKTDLPYGQTAWTLPNNLKPYEKGFTFNLTTANSTDSGGYFEITTNGDVICYTSPSKNIYLNGCITYLAA